MWQSTVIREASADALQRVWTPHEESADTSRRVQGIAEKDLCIKCREFERLAFWESLGLFLSVTTISNLGRMVFFVTDACTEHEHSVDRALTFFGQSMDVLWTEPGRSSDRAQTFRGLNTNVLQTQYECSAARCAAIHRNLQCSSSEFVRFV